MASLSSRQACRFGFRVTFCTGFRCTSAAIAEVCFSQKVLAAQAPIITVMLSGIQKAMQQMLKREKCLENFVYLAVYNRYPGGTARFG